MTRVAVGSADDLKAVAALLKVLGGAVETNDGEGVAVLAEHLGRLIGRENADSLYRALYRKFAYVEGHDRPTTWLEPDPTSPVPTTAPNA